MFLDDTNALSGRGAIPGEASGPAHLTDSLRKVNKRKRESEKKG